MRLLLLLFSWFFLWRCWAQIPEAPFIAEQEALPLTAEHLQKLFTYGLITEEDLKALSLYFEKSGQFNSIYQLQGLLTGNLSDIIQFASFIELPASPKLTLQNQSLAWSFDFHFHFPQLVHDASGCALLKDSSFNGNELGLQLRQAFVWSNWKAGFQVAKDAGERFWQQKQAPGFEFLTAYIQYKNRASSGVLDQFLLGSYQMQWGQGLLLWSSRGMGKSIDLLQLARNPNGLKPYSGKDEQRFLQGFALELQNKNQHLICFGSVKRIDAKWPTDTLQNEFIFSYATGLHRTNSELAKRKQGLEQIYGVAYQYKPSVFKVGGLLLYQAAHFRQASIDSLMSQYDMTSRSILSLSMYAQATWRQFYFYGETAWNLSPLLNAKQHSALNLALICHLHPQLELGLHLRNYGSNYQTFYANPIANQRSVSNEQGAIFQLKWQLKKRLELKCSSDWMRTPYLILSTPLPQKYADLRVSMQYQWSKLNFWRAQVSMQPNEFQFRHFRLALFIQYQLNKAEQFRMKLNWSALAISSLPSRCLELNWTHNPISAFFDFEVIYGFFRVPKDAPTQYMNAYLTGIGSRSIMLNGVGSYLLTSLQFTYLKDFRLGVFLGLTNYISIDYDQKMSISFTLSKKI